MHEPLDWPLLPRGLAVRMWARRMMLRRAVILDTETTDLYGSVVEVAAVDPWGRVLLDSLVNPEVPIAAEASAVHGILDRDVAAAPTLGELLPRLQAVIGSRPVLAYNAPYDRRVLLDDAARLSLDPGRLAHDRTWGCLMRVRASLMGGRWKRLEAGHRAADDAAAASKVLRALAHGSAA
jgi:DNA polymerase III subunit epsilon